MFIKSLTERNDNALTQQEDCHAGQHYKVDIYMDLYSAMSLLLLTRRSDMDHTVLPANYTMPAAENSPPVGWYSFYGFIVPRRVEG